MSFIEPCLPTISKHPPSGPERIFELKHDGYRLMVRRDADRVCIASRCGFDLASRFPRVAQAVRRLKVHSIVLDGEGTVYGSMGMPSFERIHSKQYDGDCFRSA